MAERAAVLAACIVALATATACARPGPDLSPSQPPQPAVATAGAPTAEPAGAAAGRAAALEALSRRQDALFEALSARDPDRTAAFFADDAVLHVAGMPPIEGRAAVRRFYGNVFRYLSGSTATPLSTHVSASGDLAYGTGVTVNEFDGPEGSVEYEGKYVLVWKRTAGDWRVQFYGISSNEPEAARQRR